MRKIRNFPRYRKSQERAHRRYLYLNHRKRRESTFRKGRLKTKEKLVRSRSLAIPAPPNFSFINNTEGMIIFLDRLRVALDLKQSVLVDLSEVVEITNDALIAMLSVIQDPRVANNVEAFVKLPEESSKVAARLRESGIREQFAGLQDVVPAKHGRIRNKWSLEADTSKANELIAFATKEVFGRKKQLRDVQRILSECVDNTTFHASGKRDRKLHEAWWATVFCEGNPKVAYFSVLDNGVGIAEHLKINWLNQLKLLKKYQTNPDLLKAVFEGAVLSSTGLSNRGNGLPAIFRARSRGQFSALIVITNNVYIDFDQGLYRELPKPFRGTFFYWEVRKP
jgi:hypothetical protein